MKRIKVFTENTETQMQNALDKWIDEIKPNIDKTSCSITWKHGEIYPVLMVTVCYW
jgi:hypothetical protein